jgi:hypothetical protein
MMFSRRIVEVEYKDHIGSCSSKPPLRGDGCVEEDMKKKTNSPNCSAPATATSITMDSCEENHHHTSSSHHQICNSPNKNKKCDDCEKGLHHHPQKQVINNERRGGSKTMNPTTCCCDELVGDGEKKRKGFYYYMMRLVKCVQNKWILTITIITLGVAVASAFTVMGVQSSRRFDDQYFTQTGEGMVYVLFRSVCFQRLD